jgi:formylglycine-generating enzyme required for sulfatase activity
LVESFLDTWQFGSADPERVKHQNGWIKLLSEGEGRLLDLLDATERRYKELGQPPPPVFLLYVDQGEELYVRSEQHERRRFSEILAQGVTDPRLYALMSLRADFFGELQKDRPLYKAHRQINVPPLGETELLAVITQPAKLLSVRFETDHLATDIANRAAEESTKDAGALPLLSYLLDDMWRRMVERGDGYLRLPAQSIELGRVLVDRANAFISRHPNSEDILRRIFTLKLATVREDGEPTRRRASRQEFSDEEWRLVSELADHPNRLLVTATPEAGGTPLVPETAKLIATPTASGETYAEVAHEAIFRRWDKLRDWIAAEREFLAWRSVLEAARRAWQATPASSKNDALLMGFPLAQGQSWLRKRAADIPEADREFIVQSRKAAQRRRLRVQALVGVLVAAMVAGLAAWRYEQWLNEQVFWLTNVRGHVLTAERERVFEASREPFKECVNCPEMVIVPAGEFMMGSLANEKGHSADEGPQHKVTIAKAFAVSRFELTFDEWDNCAVHGDCDRHIRSSWGRGGQPVINVSWDDAQRYVAWLSRITGQPYRLLSEAEWEYAARAGTTTAYSWGDDIKKDGKAMANCNNECGSQWDNRQTAPVGSFVPNAFGLYDMAGNVGEWVEDCHHPDYKKAPTDGSAWITGDCSRRVVRGGSWVDYPQDLRSANRLGDASDNRDLSLGFRVGRTLTP